MIEYNKLNIKDSPLYIKPKNNKNYYRAMIILAIAVIIIGITGIICGIKASTTIIEQQAEIDRLQNKVYQDIELIDSLKQVYYK